MSGAVFGKSYPFRGADEDSHSGREDFPSHGEALRIILDLCIPLVVLGRKHLSKPWLPKKLSRASSGHPCLPRTYDPGLRGRKGGHDAQREAGKYLMTSLVRASLDNVDQKASSTECQEGGLTGEAVYGNIFVFNFAGHDATINSLAIGICLLATEPNNQDWIAEEINAVSRWRRIQGSIL